MFVKVAKSIDDHRPLTLRVGQAANAAKKINPNGFHEAKVKRVVDMPHSVHVAPPNRDLQLMDFLFYFWQFKFYALDPSSSVVT